MFMKFCRYWPDAVEKIEFMSGLAPPSKNSLWATLRRGFEGVTIRILQPAFIEGTYNPRGEAIAHINPNMVSEGS